MGADWINNVNNIEQLQDRKVLISFGNGPRDVLVPSGLTSYNHSFISALVRKKSSLNVVLMHCLRRYAS